MLPQRFHHICLGALSQPPFRQFLLNSESLGSEVMFEQNTIRAWTHIPAQETSCVPVTNNTFNSFSQSWELKQNNNKNPKTWNMCWETLEGWLYVIWFGIIDFLKVAHEEKGKKLLLLLLCLVHKPGSFIGSKRRKVIDCLLTEYRHFLYDHIYILLILLALMSARNTPQALNDCKTLLFQSHT